MRNYFQKTSFSGSLKAKKAILDVKSPQKVNVPEIL